MVQCHPTFNLLWWLRPSLARPYTTPAHGRWATWNTSWACIKASAQVSWRAPRIGYLRIPDPWIHRSHALPLIPNLGQNQSQHHVSLTWTCVFSQAWKFRSCSPWWKVHLFPRASACWNQEVSITHIWTPNIIQVMRHSMWRFGYYKHVFLNIP